MKTGIAVLGVATALAMAAPTWAQTKQVADAGQQAFVRAAIQGDLAEVQMGRLAQAKAGGNKQLQRFGQTLVTDHSANRTKAEALARQLNVAPPGSPKAEQQHMYQELSRLQGAQFEKKFASAMVADHRRDVAKFQAETKSPNPQIAQFAQATVPVLKKHLRDAEALAKSTGADKPQTARTHSAPDAVPPAR